MKGWVYILKCGDDTYYTGSTNNLVLRMLQHKSGNGSNYTAKRLPVELIYFEEYTHVADAFYREKQIQGWSRRKKDALMKKDFGTLKLFSVCYKEFESAINGTNTKFNLQNIAQIQDIKSFISEDTSISELLDLLSKYRK